MAFVKSVSIENNTGTAQLTLVFASTSYANGNTLTVEVGWENSVAVSTITDAASQSWNVETRELHTLANINVQAFHIGNITGLSGTVTLTFASPGCIWAHAVLKEFNGMPAVANNKDQYITAEGTQTAGPLIPPASGNVTTTQGDEVCTSMVKAATGETFSAQQINGVGASNIITFSDTVAFNTYPTATFTGQATASMNVNAHWVMALLTLKANITSGATPAVISKYLGRSIGIGIGRGIF